MRAETRFCTAPDGVRLAYDEMQTVSSTGEMAARLWLSRSDFPISDTARQVAEPALVLHARQDQAVPYEEGRHLASLIPDARLVTLESDNHILQEHEPAWGCSCQRCVRSWATTSAQPPRRSS